MTTISEKLRDMAFHAQHGNERRTSEEAANAIDALVGALEAIRDYPPAERRTEDGYPAEVVYDEYAYRRVVDSYREAADAALALARGERA